MPAGNALTQTNYAVGESADVPCSGMGTIDQRGLPQSVIRGDQAYSTYYDAMGRTIALATNGKATKCVYRDQTGAITRSVTPARGDQPERVSDVIKLVDGDPFKVRTEVRIDGDLTYTTQSHSDLAGNVISSTDPWDVTLTQTFDPLTGDKLTSTTTDKSSRQISALTYRYYNDGPLAEITRNDETVASLTVPDESGTTITYGNGVVVQVSPDETGNLEEQTWKTSSGDTYRYSNEISPTQRVLSENLSFGGKKAVYDYTYDEQSRLVGADLSTGLPAEHKQWQYWFDATPTGRSNVSTMQMSRHTSTTRTTNSLVPARPTPLPIAIEVN